MTTVLDICTFLDAFAPPHLAEDWDNVGLLVGRHSAAVQALSTCLTLSPDVADEAISEGVQLIVSHHPVMFRPVQQLTETTLEGGMLLQLIEAGVAVYSPHTRFDSAPDGINQSLANDLGLQHIKPLRPVVTDPEFGSGRTGELAPPTSLSAFLGVVKQATAAEYLEYVGDPQANVQRVGVACGAAAEFMSDAASAGCDTFVTGEARFHSAVEARSLGMNLVLTGHFSSERPAVERLATLLSESFPDVRCMPSRVESDPLQLFKD
jgi:dinuclear metal center YbgI/SA1388 family protein